MAEVSPDERARWPGPALYGAWRSGDRVAPWSLLRIHILVAAITLAGLPACGDTGDDDGADARTLPPVERVTPDSGPATDSAADAAVGAGPAEVRAPAVACRGASEASECVEGVEALNLARVPGRVQGTDSMLSIRTGAGWVRFPQSDRPGDAYLRHFFAGQFPDRRYAVVERQLYVGLDYILVDWRTGDTITVTGAPVPSPGGGHVAVYERDYDGSGGEEVLEIWSYRGDRPRKQWSCRSGYGYGPEDLRWEDDGSLHFVWVDRNENYVMATASRDPGTGEWEVDPLPPGSSGAECGPV